jgi:AcrR family transcriptional regulator
MTDEDLGLRERKKQQTRTALSWAAVRLCVTNGYENVRVEDIAAEAGVSLRTFRNYFANKAEAIVARERDRAMLVAGELRARPAAEPLWDALNAAVHTHLSMGVDGDTDQPPTPDWVTGVQAMIAHPAVRGEALRALADAEGQLARAVAERTGTDADHDLYPRLVAATATAARSAALAHWQRADPPVAIGPLLTDAFGQLAAGLPEPS